MDITVNKSDNFFDRPLKRKNRHIGCFFLLGIFFLAIGIGAFMLRSYIAIIPTLFKVTGAGVARTKTETNLTYKYNGQKYINILLLGSDNDAKFNPANVLTQTVIIISLNTQTNTVNMISIPRDYWVPIQGISGGYGKIDQASGLGGLALARQTVEQDFGVHIDYYAWVGLQGFVKVIDTFGGIDVDVNHPILDDLYPNDISGNDPYGAIRLYIPSGAQHLSGIQALQYVRSRHGDLNGDFGRSARQQQVLLTLEQKAKDANIIADVPTLVSELQDSIRTDMSLADLTKLTPILTSSQHMKINRYILSVPDYATNGWSPDGTQEIVIPDFTKINALFATLFN